jgi:hypothetical protein
MSQAEYARGQLVRGNLGVRFRQLIQRFLDLKSLDRDLRRPDDCSLKTTRRDVSLPTRGLNQPRAPDSIGSPPLVRSAGGPWLAQSLPPVRSAAGPQVWARPPAQARSAAAPGPLSGLPVPMVERPAMQRLALDQPSTRIYRMTSRSMGLSVTSQPFPRFGSTKSQPGQPNFYVDLAGKIGRQVPPPSTSAREGPAVRAMAAVRHLSGAHLSELVGLWPKSTRSCWPNADHRIFFNGLRKPDPASASPHDLRCGVKLTCLISVLQTVADKTHHAQRT